MAEDALGPALERLIVAVAARAGGDPAQSYTAKLLRGGVPTCAKKLGEEAVETALALVSETPEAVAEETADLLYHLIVALKAAGVSPAAAAAVLTRREGVGGLEEKASRPRA